MLWRLCAGVVALALVPGCGAAGGGRPAHQPVEPTSVSSPTPAPTSGIPTWPPAPGPSPSPRPLPARFRGTISPLPPSLAARMRGRTWRPGCPVRLGRLRLLTLRYWGFDGLVHEGPMVVNASVAEDVVWVFRTLFRARFPIRQIHLAVPYRPGHDDPNDRRDYTVGFNCRPVVTARGPRDVWSQHAYGLAIDINPIENPYVASDGYVRNVHARPYRDRSLHRPGMIRPGDVVVRAFAAIGWAWGGSWHADKDYMHFSLTGK